jgi:putative MATE family efflux protein
MAAPMLGATFAMSAFNLTDTYFVARLGTLPLAAMGFSFPVVMFLTCIVQGLGTGGTAVVSHALGRGDRDSARRITTHTLLLALAAVLLISVAGLLTIDPVFRALGAGDEVLQLIRGYMVIWYLGVAFMVLPMMMGEIIRATGDTVRPSVLMLVAALVNMVLDPILIFGLLGLPALGIRGAALATVAARGLSCAGAFWVLHTRHRLLLLELPSFRAMRGSWRQVLRIGLPASFSNLLMPLSGAVITRIIAHFGVAAVAAVSAGSRLEFFAFMIPMCLGISLVPFVGQNFGAGRLDRVRDARRLSMTFAFAFGLLTFALFFVSAPALAGLFARDREVAVILTRYLRIASVGHGMMEVHRYAGFFLNGVHQPLHAVGVNTVRVLVLLVPLSLLGGAVLGLEGVFWGRALTDLIAGAVGVVWSGRILRRLARPGNPAEPHPHPAANGPLRKIIP